MNVTARTCDSVASLLYFSRAESIIEKMSGEKITISRPLVGILALACLGSAVGLWIAFPKDEYWNLWRGGFVRVGTVMSVLWLALPSRHRPAAWANVSKGTFIGIFVAVIATARLSLRIVLPIFVAVVVIGFFLRPRGKTRPANRPSRSAD